MAKKKKGAKASLKAAKSATIQEPLPPPEPRLLTEDAIYFWTNIEEKEPPAVPPPTPKNISNVKTVSDGLPKVFPKLDDLEVPYVREVGVQKCIKVLGQHLGCNNFAFDYLQFWLLDVLTDCLWKAQDEYHLDVPEQKLVLSWVLYMFQIMTDPKLSYSRRTFFNVFKEAILIAGDIINEGEADVPPPDNLFTLAPSQDDEEERPDEEAASDADSTSSDDSSTSTITISTYKSKDVVEMEIGEETRTYVIKKKICDCTLDESIESYTSTKSTTATSESTNAEAESPDENVADEQRDDVVEEQKIEEYYVPVQYKDYDQFYHADPAIPKRFLPLQEEQSAEQIEEETIHECEETSTEQSIVPEQGGENAERPSAKKRKQKKFDVDFSYMDKVSSSVLCPKSEPTQNVRSTTSSDAKGDVEALTESQVLKQLARYKLWEQRMKDMDDPGIGWVPDDGSEESSKKKNSTNSTEDATEETATEEEEMCDRKLICFGVLCTIIDFVFDYFYRSFHFTLVKLSTRATQNVITQQLNNRWNVPKTIKQPLVRPKPPPKKKEKKKKDKKSSKGSKKSKKSKDKKSKKSAKDKKSKKSDKSGKSGKKKKEAPKKLTKEEKEELERQRKLKEEMEAEFKRLEENKRFMFPLADAADDELFTGIFENWVRPKEKKEKGKKEKGKKGKGKKKK